MDFLSLFTAMFFIIFLLFIVIFIMNITKGVSAWNKNNQSPRLTVEAQVVAKRTDVTFHNQGSPGDINGGHGFTATSSTRYYVTFQFESGDRIELPVAGQDYGILVEGDKGRLSFQGTRYLGFDRC